MGKINKNEMSIVLDLQSKSSPQLSVQTNSLELIFYWPLIKKEIQVMKI